MGARASGCLLAFLAVLPVAGRAQGVADRTPNLANGWSPRPGVVQLNLLHRFEMSEAPLRKVTNTPTFHVATGVVRTLGVGFTYGSNSDLVTAYPNEWEWFARWTPLAQGSGAPLDASLQTGWNLAAESFDTELSLARHFGPVRLLAAGRAFHHAFYRDRARYALAGGAALRLTSWLSASGDYASLLDRAADERAVWGAGLQLSVPYTPHSVSLHASNVGTGSLEGASRGGRTRWGFEYTVPITLRRYSRRRSRDAMTGTMSGDSSSMSASTHGQSMAAARSMNAATDMSASATMGAMERADTVVVTIKDLKYQQDAIVIDAGDVVVWRNADPLAHTVTADGEAFESPMIEPGKSWSFRFTTPGTYTYHCEPHPFMKAKVTVRQEKR